ncbi:MAG TPA: glycosyltransferase family 2 protein [Tepidisphaeraceae bacterium]|nr:glycosyltransferase family 2 protein [Tepidisphaeraceae bacterium]
MNLILYLLTTVLAVPSLVFFIECVFGAVAKGSNPHYKSEDTERSQLAVLIPAHNEEKTLGGTLMALKSELRSGDRVIVIADNSTDSTASIARYMDVEVVERVNDANRGKGFALASGVNYLAKNPPDILVLLDADTLVEPGSLDVLRGTVVRLKTPAQALYLLAAPPIPSVRDLISTLAFTVKNQARPAALEMFGMPCQITGSGVALPWTALQYVNLSSGNLVEDMQLGIDLAIAGFTPVHCSSARVTGSLPSGSIASAGQRTRWEHGHVRTLFTQVPRLAREAVRQRRLTLMIMALDLCVPPLSLLVLLLAMNFTLGLTWALATYQLGPLLVSSAALVIVGIGVFSVWFRHGRATISLGQLLLVPAYLLWKIPIYASLLFKPQRTWVRTPRDNSVESSL